MSDSDPEPQPQTPRDRDLEAAFHTLASLQSEIHRNNVSKGFWPDTSAKTDEAARAIALMHSELSELLEAVRSNPRADCGKPIGLDAEAEEVADVFIRLLDYCGRRGIFLGAAVLAKHRYNLTRPHKHGKQF